MNGMLGICLIALVTALTAGLQAIPPDLLPAWANPLVTGVLAGLGILGGYLKGLSSAPAGMTQVPTRNVAARSAGIGLLVLLLLGPAVLPLSACAGVEAVTPAQQVYAAEAEYAAAVGQAATYEARPRCGADGADPAMCSDPRTVAALRHADDVAFAALQAARASPTPATTAALASALASFRTSLSEIAR